jgi:hypothetical protein
MHCTESRLKSFLNSKEELMDLKLLDRVRQLAIPEFRRRN